MMFTKLKKLTQKYPFIRVLLYPVIIFKRLFIKSNKKQKVIDEIIYNLCEIVDEDIVINVPEFHGRFAISPKSDIFLRILSVKKYEPELVRLCLRYMDTNKDVIDVGANIGFYSVLFAKNVTGTSRVIAIEPTENSIRRLKYNLELNEISQKVEIFEGAASINNDEAIIELMEGKEEYSSLGKIKYPGMKEEQLRKSKVKCITLDTLVKEKQLNPGFIKVDVEGCEHLVFQGGLNTLLIFRPIILSEVCEEYLNKGGASIKEVIQLLRSYNYDVYDVKNSNSPLGKDTLNYPKASNILCFPRELKIKNIE